MHSHNASPIWRKLYVLHTKLGLEGRQELPGVALFGCKPTLGKAGFFWVISLLQHNASTFVLERFPAGTTWRLTRAGHLIFWVSIHLPIIPLKQKWTSFHYSVLIV